jgi:hypothetical protein
MTSPVSQTVFANNTKNTKDNRKVVVARWWTPKSVFKIPNNLDLEDKNIVKEWWVKYNTLYIKYIDEENYIKYTGEKPNKDNTQEIENNDDSYTDYQWPEEQQIADADDYGVEYEEDEEEEEEDEKEEKDEEEEKI